MEGCRECGAENRPTARFCGACGASLATERPCPSCGAEQPVGLRFCDECGSALERPAPPPTAVVPPAVTTAADGGAALVSDRYRVQRLLGEGARKVVHLATDTMLARDVALAVFKTEGLEAGALDRARREAEAMARLGDHPNIVTVFDIGEGPHGELFLVSQLMPGGDLAEVLARAPHGRMEVAEVVRVGTQVAAALEHAHRHGIVHRDLKPQNVWLTEEGTAKLGDFGLATAQDGARLTADGAIVGTVAYMSPEQGLGRPADPRSDLYALGAVLYELLCGAPPFQGDVTAIISQHVSAVPVAPSWHRDDVPDALEQLVLRLLAKAPEERYASAAEVGEALQTITALAVEGEPSPATAAVDRLLGGPFFGRDQELAELRSRVDEAIAGRGGLVMVAGDAGMGKTRLAAEVERYAALRGALVLWGRCYEGEGAPAYWPWIQVIRTYAKARDRDALLAELGSGVSDVAQVVSELRSQVLDLPPPQLLDPDQSRFQLFDAITTFLRNASTSRPLVLVLEDLHLADPPSLQLLQFLVRELPRTRLLVTGTFRDGELPAGHPFLEADAAMHRERGYHRLRLRPLDHVEVQALLEATARQRLTSPDERALVAAVHRESGGNPFFIEEIVRHLLESGAVYEQDGRWVSDARRIEDLGIPRGIRDAIDRRLTRLSERCRTVLGTAAAFGYELSTSLLCQVTGLEVAEVAPLVLEAVEAGVLVQHPEEPGAYRFVHVVTRDALYDALPQAERAELHRTIGELLEAHYGDRLELHLGELAHHFGSAAVLGLQDKAADYAQRAGLRAAALAAHDDAAAHLDRALRLLGTDADPDRRCDLLLALGAARRRIDQVGRARQSFTEAATLAERTGSAERYARAAVGYGGPPGGLAASDRADTKLLHLLRSALRVLPDEDSAMRVRVMSRLAVELSLTDDPDAPDDMSRAAVAMADRLDDPRLVLLARYSRQWATMGPDGVAEGAEEADEIVRLARRLGDGEVEFHGRHLRVHALLQLGDLAGVERELRACERLAGSLRQPTFDWQVTVFRAMRELGQGRFAAGEALAAEALGIGQHGHGDVAGLVFGAQAFLAGWATGGLGALLDGAEALATGYPDSAWPAARTMLLSESGDLERARQSFAPYARTGFQQLRRDANWATAIACLSMTCHALEDAAAAEALYDLLVPYAELTTSVLTGSAALGSNHFFCGLTAETAGRRDDAIAHYAAALAAHQANGLVFLVPRLRYVLARALLARDGAGDRDEAARHVELGLDEARSIGALPEVEHLLSVRLGPAGLVELDPRMSIALVARSVERNRPDLGRATAPDGTVTIMFSDIEGSTALTDRLGDRRWMELLGVHNRIVREAVTAHGGYEVKSQGDGFMIAFASATKAVHCACAIQRALAEHRSSGADEPLHVRIGLHTGEVVREEEDFFGRNVILAARIAAKADGDEILVSGLLRELIASSGDFAFGAEQDLELKGLSGVQRVAEVRWATS